MIDPADSASARPYLTAEADLRDAAVSPDGAILAYISNETGAWEVYVRSFPTPGQPVKVSNGFGLNPRWAPDGNTIYYWSSRPSAEDSLIAARVQRTRTFAVLAREAVLVGDYASGSADLHPDGGRFVLAVPAGADGQGEREPERFLIVTNWLAELRAALGGN